MTSEQQIRNLFTVCDIIEIEACFFIEVKVDSVPYIIGMGTSRYRAFTDATNNLGFKRIFGHGNYQKDKLKKKIV